MQTISLKQLQEELGQLSRVKQFAPNHIEIRYENGQILQSYASIVAAHMNGRYYFTEDHDYSHTTCKYVTRWCNLKTPERRQALKNGSAIFVTM